MARTTFSGPVASLNGFLNVSDNNNTVAITAPSALAASYTLTLPPNDGNSGQYLSTNGNGVLSWTAGDGSGTVTSVSTAGTVNGLTLTGGPITGSGTITLGGTLDLSSPPAIGSGTPNTGAFSDVTSGTYKAADGTTGMTIANSTGRVGISTGLAMTDATDVAFGTTTGTKFGTTTSQKLGFFAATPIVQPTTGVVAAAFAANTSGILDDTATFGGYTIGQVVAALKNLGLLA